MALIIDDNVLAQAEALADADDVAGAWGVLAAAGESYAEKARPIIAEWQDPQSIFAMMVDVQWARVGVSAADKQANFLLVGKRHLENYLRYITNDPEHRLPKTDFIEQSYRESLEFYGLPPAAAIDSIFSAADLQMESQLSLGVEDISWGTHAGHGGRADHL